MVRATGTRGWIRWGSEGFCHDVSSSFARMLGFSKPRFLVHNWTLLIHPDDRKIVRHMATQVQRGEVPPPVQARWLKRRGSFATLEMRFFHSRDGKGHHEDILVGEVRRFTTQRKAS